MQDIRIAFKYSNERERECVRASNSMYSVDIIHTETAPSRAPRSVGHSISNTTTLTLSWRPPQQQFHNGIIRGYNINITEVLTATTMYFNTPTTSLAVPSLHPYYEYEYTVAAYTVSVGPYSSVNRVQMPEDGE